MIIKDHRYKEITLNANNISEVIEKLAELDKELQKSTNVSLSSLHASLNTIEVTWIEDVELDDDEYIHSLETQIEQKEKNILHYKKDINRLKQQIQTIRDNL